MEKQTGQEGKQEAADSSAETAERRDRESRQGRRENEQGQTEARKTTRGTGRKNNGQLGSGRCCARQGGII